MTLTKRDLKDDLRPLYAATLTPRFIEVPCLPYLMLDGHGDPNTTPGYAVAVSTIYGIAHALKSALRNSGEGVDFTVMPLEGLWWSGEKIPYRAADHPSWDWTLLIALPDFVSAEMIEETRMCVGHKSAPEAVSAVRFATLCEGPCAQVMHIGSDSNVAATVARLHEFIRRRGRVAVGRHHEIYLSDPDRTAPHRLKTVIRQPVVPAAG